MSDEFDLMHLVEQIDNGNWPNLDWADSAVLPVSF